MQAIQKIIEDAWEDRATLQPGTAPAKIGEAVATVLGLLDEGKLRVAEKIDGPNGKDWFTHQWIKKAVLLSFRLEDNKVSESGALRYYDKVPTKFENYDAEKFARGGFRVVPPGTGICHQVNLEYLGQVAGTYLVLRQGGADGAAGTTLSGSGGRSRSSCMGSS